MTAINNMLAQLSEDELSDKRKQAESILRDKESTSKERAISEHIIYYCEVLRGNASETDATVGIFE